MVARFPPQVVIVQQAAEIIEFLLQVDLIVFCFFQKSAEKFKHIKLVGF